MNQIKTISLRILKIFIWIIFLFSTYLILFGIIPEIYQGRISERTPFIDLIVLLVIFGIAFMSGYTVHEALFIPFRALANLTFERKMMLIVVIAIVVGVSFYCWSVWEKQMYFEDREQERKQEREHKTLEEIWGEEVTPGTSLEEIWR